MLCLYLGQSARSSSVDHGTTPGINFRLFFAQFVVADSRVFPSGIGARSGLRGISPRSFGLSITFNAVVT